MVSNYLPPLIPLPRWPEHADDVSAEHDGEVAGGRALLDVARGRSRVPPIGENCRCRPAAGRVWVWSWWGKLDVSRGSVRVWSAGYAGLGIGT